MAYQTAAQLNSIQMFTCKLYVNGVEVGIIDQGDVKFSTDFQIGTNGSQATGEGNMVSFTKGAMSTCEFTISTFNKDINLDLFEGMLVAGTTATAVSTPMVGTLQVSSIPRVLPENTFVLYPMWVDRNGTAYKDDDQNPLAVKISRGVIASPFEMNGSTGDTYKLSLTLNCLADPTLDYNTPWIMDDGITTAGVYTP
jgi:hypothetical protein